MAEYQGRLPLFHVDLYRLGDGADALAGGLLDERQAAGVTLVEQYTAETALRTAFPARELEVHVSSVGTLQGGPASMQFSCNRLPHGVEFAANY